MLAKVSDSRVALTLRLSTRPEFTINPRYEHFASSQGTEESSAGAPQDASGLRIARRRLAQGSHCAASRELTSLVAKRRTRGSSAFYFRSTQDYSVQPEPNRTPRRRAPGIFPSEALLLGSGFLGEQRRILTVALLLQVLGRHETQGSGVHAEAEAGRSGTVVEHMSQM